MHVNIWSCIIDLLRETIEVVALAIRAGVFTVSDTRHMVVSMQPLTTRQATLLSPWVVPVYDGVRRTDLTGGCVLVDVMSGRARNTAENSESS